MEKSGFGGDDRMKEKAEFAEGVILQKMALQQTSSRRSIVLDEENFEDMFLRCSVCREHFKEFQRIPKLLPCHHSYCLPCIQQLFKTEIEFRQNLTGGFIRGSQFGGSVSVSIHCPACRGSFHSSKDNLANLPTDHRIIQLIDFFKHLNRFNVAFCTKHSTMPLNFFCEMCIKPVCRDCTVIDHRERDGHVVMDMEEAQQKYKPILDSAIAEMEKESSALEQKQSLLQATSINLEKARTEIIHEIQESFQRLRASLNERERELQTMVEAEMNKGKGKFDEKVELLKSRRNFLSDNMEMLKAAKGENNIERMFCIHAEFRGYMAEAPIRIRESDDVTISIPVFNGREEQILSSKINIFGELNLRTEPICQGSSQYSPSVRSHSHR